MTDHQNIQKSLEILLTDIRLFVAALDTICIGWHWTGLTI